MLTPDSYPVSPTKSFDIEIAAAPPGKKLPLVVVIHGNFGLVGPFGQQLRDFTEQLAALGFVAALPSYYDKGGAQPEDTDISDKVPLIEAAIKHLSKRTDVDGTRVGLVGFSLGGGIALSYINLMPPKTTRAFVDFYGYVAPVLGSGVEKCPPTLVFHNENDPMVDPAAHSERLLDALSKAGIDHEPAGPPYHWYNERWILGLNHAFQPGNTADVESRRKAGEWLVKYV